MENEILKRAATYFARENVLPHQSTRWSANSPTTISTSRGLPDITGLPFRETLLRAVR
jgi:hypothetical protein